MLLAPPGATETRLLLAKAINEQQESSIGVHAGGRVFLVLHMDHFERQWTRMIAVGVHLRESPRYEACGKVAVFKIFAAMRGICCNRATEGLPDQVVRHFELRVILVFIARIEIRRVTMIKHDDFRSASTYFFCCGAWQ